MDCGCLWVKHPSFPRWGLHYPLNQSIIEQTDHQTGSAGNMGYSGLYVIHIRSDVSTAKEIGGNGRQRRECLENLTGFASGLTEARIRGSELESVKLVDALNGSGRAFLTQAMLGGFYVIRCSIGTTLTQDRHVDDLWKLIQEKADRLLSLQEGRSMAVR
ncbi:hypothetical protein CUMW_273030 [Citrus unshiu]|uniref:Uncharacterized protein n=1 Tax=Citrus unshiu TaxID=55188 RepID=A0A2H5MVD5_CITUN|nr:hypothetical protein CUMW_273030 [Citrus unshiu]